jgi:GNAT superfamily N-acetyltransferase
VNPILPLLADEVASKEIVPRESPATDLPPPGCPGPAPSIELHPARPGPRQLERINQIVTAAIGTWQLPERVRRISLPLYRYSESDLQYMQLVIARDGRHGEIVGLATVEAAEASDFPYREALLLHGIYVDPRYHRRGVGSRLLRAAEALAEAGEASGLLVRAQPDAVDFFDASGYHRLPIEDPLRDYAYRYWKPLRRGATD